MPVNHLADQPGRPGRPGRAGRAGWRAGWSSQLDGPASWFGWLASQPVQSPNPRGQDSNPS